MGAGESTNEDEERKANMTEAPPKNLESKWLEPKWLRIYDIVIDHDIDIDIWMLILIY